MTTPIDPGTVPTEPVYTVLVSGGGVTLNGRPVPVPEGGDLRTTALEELRICAAQRDHPVRATAKEPDGSTYHLVVGIDGQVLTLPDPHPVVSPGPDPWKAPPPTPFAALLRTVRVAELAGRLSDARDRADELHAGLRELLGEAHPQAVNGLALRAYLALRAGDWASATPLALDAARRLHRGRAGHDETVRVARNGVVSWRRLRAKTPGAATRYADEVREAARIGGLPADRLATVDDAGQSILAAAEELW